jgi:predicted dehydrogenase
MRVAIIGCGLIGRKRAKALSPDDQLVACCDTDAGMADQFATNFLCDKFYDYQTLLKESDPDAVVVAVVNKYMRDIVVASLRKGLNVLAEKPLGRNVTEAGDMVALSLEGDQLHNSLLKPVLKTGFNHRFHPALNKAKTMSEAGDIGRILSIRARYGHGGRPGMEHEWRASRDLCGGGELLDQGVHIIDLIRWFGGDIATVVGRVERKFWNMEVEDSAFAILTTKDDVTASFHVSWYNWRNIFSFEVFGTDGYLRIEGLGGSYGPESLEFGLRKKEGGRPDVQTFSFPDEDISWRQEWLNFKASCSHRQPTVGSGIDGLRANEVVQAIAESHRQARVVTIG